MAAALAVPAGEEKKAPKDTDKLQGIWRPTSITSRGKQVADPVEDGPNYSFAAVGDRFIFMKIYGGTFTLDPDKGLMDWEVTAGRYAGKTVPCRYELKDDTLKLIFPSSILNPVRPPVAKAGDDPVCLVVTFQRDGKATKEDADKYLKDRTAALAAKAPFGPGGLPGGAGGPGGPAGGGFKGGKWGKGGGGFAVPGGGGGFAPPAAGGAAPPAAAEAPATEKLLERILERLERIEQRLDALEKRLPPPK
jgi:uncharacterized protein (TIGR03067 family)